MADVTGARGESPCLPKVVVEVAEESVLQEVIGGQTMEAPEDLGS